MNTIKKKHNVIIGPLFSYFSQYTGFFTKPTSEKFIWLCIGVLAMYSVHSIRFLHNWFLQTVTNSSLNSFYYLLSYTQLDIKHLMQITTKIAFSCIPSKLKTLPVFIVIDDTLQEKFGIHFECRKKLFDHAAHNGSNYLNGHCFVGLIIKIPVYMKEQEICYLTVPVGYRLKKNTPDKSKLQIASEMIDWVMDVLKKHPMVILLCDSWYPKGDVLKTVEKHLNLELIANVRADSVLFDLPPEPTNKRGRPRKKGDRLDIHNQQQFNFTKIGEYFIASRKVITNLFGKIAYATVTASALDKEKSYKLFISTVMPEQLEKMLPVLDEKVIEKVPQERIQSLLPYMLYRFRWSIEVVFYEQKTFWSFGKYMLRSAMGIENYVNILNISYTCTKLLPWVDSNFAELKSESSQNTKYILSHYIHRDILFASFASDTENANKYFQPAKSLKQRLLDKLCS